MSESAETRKPYVWWPTLGMGVVLLVFGAAMTRGTAPLIGVLVAVVGIVMAVYALTRRNREARARH